MTTNEPTVFVVDDDEELCAALRWLIESAGMRAETHTSAESFLATYDPSRPGCLVLDVRMQGMSGLELQQKLAAHNALIPIIILTAHGDVPMAVRAVKAGALEFLQKPVNDGVLLDKITKALQRDADNRRDQALRTEIASRMKMLTPREREVLDLVVSGMASKHVAAELGLSERTVEVHRKHIMRKMKTRSVVELVRAVMSLRSPSPR